MHSVRLVLNAVILTQVDQFGRAPIELLIFGVFRPRSRVIAPLGNVSLTLLRIHDPAMLSVGLVKPARIRVEEHAAVRVKDRLEPDALPLVLIVQRVLILSPQAPCTNAASHTLVKGVVICFLCATVLLVRTIQAIANVGQVLFGRTVLRHKVGGNAVIPIFGVNPHQCSLHLVNLGLRLVLELVAQSPFPLTTRHSSEAPILLALLARLLSARPNAIEHSPRFAVNLRQPLFFIRTRHHTPLQLHARFSTIALFCKVTSD